MNEITFQQKEWPTGLESVSQPWGHATVASFINPILSITPEQAERIDTLRETLLQRKNAEAVKLGTPDGVTLEGVFLHGKKENEVILFALGSGGHYEAIADETDAASHFVDFFQNTLERSVMVINTRGVVKSTGTASFEGASLDYYVAWKYLQSRKCTVFPWGHSLGFYEIVQTAAWIQIEEPETKVNIASDRSFADISQVIGAFVGGYSGSVAKITCWTIGWGENITHLWNTLRGSTLVLVAPDDQRVPYETVSFYKQIEETTIGKVIKLLGEESPHTRAYTEDEGKEIKAFVDNVFQIKTI